MPDMFRGKSLHPYGKSLCSGCCANLTHAYSSRGVNMFVLHFTDQGEIWKRMQGMFCNSDLVLHYVMRHFHKPTFGL